MGFERVAGLVSIVIPCYNAEKYIEEALNSIAAQTYRNVEIIIVNDGSTDQVVNIINKWKSENSKFKLTIIDLPYNVGYAGANTIGLFLARGEFIAIHDADDISQPTRIKKQVQFLKKNKDIDMVGTHVAWFKDHNPEKKTKFNFIKDDEETIRKRYVEDQKSAASYGSLLFRGKVFDKIGGLVRTLPGSRKVTGHDFLFINKCLQDGFRLKNIPEVLYFYRRHEKQMSRQNPEE